MGGRYDSPHSHRLSRPYVRAPQWCNPGLPHAATIIISAFAFLPCSLLSGLISPQTQQRRKGWPLHSTLGFKNSQMCKLQRRKCSQFECITALHS